MISIRKHGFTLIELLVVIAILSLLVSILLPSLTRAKALAKEVVGMTNCRSLMRAYTFYYMENDDALLYGYSPGSVGDTVLSIQDEQSGHSFGPPVVNRYPWRISPYLEDTWGVIYSHESFPPRPAQQDSTSEAFSKAYAMSVSPTFGINAVFVGGYFSPFYEGFINQGTTAQPNRGRHVVFGATEVRRPSELIVFADSKMRGGGQESGDKGLYWVTPPRANGQKWRVDNGKIVVTDKSSTIGIPEGRFTDRTITGFFDGHVEALGASKLDDMRLWANGAKGADYDFK